MRAEDLAALKAAGIYDPAGPKAAERLALLEWLATQGISLAEMLETAGGGVRGVRTLTGLAGDHVLRGPESRMTIEELARRTEISVERLERIRLAVGLPLGKPGEAVFTEADVAGYRMFEQGAQIFGEVPTLQFMRVVGGSLARIAEAGVSLFLVNVEGPIDERGRNELELAKANLSTVRSFELIPATISLLLRSHLEIAIRRMRSVREEHSVDLVRMTVGFVDLTGYTELSRKLSARELAELVADFEGIAHDVVTSRGGRLVKMIGDEVMFVAVDGTSACDAALTLMERFAGHGAVTPRGGLAHGPLLMRGGDYYGPIVNMASRIAEVAVPDEVLVTEEVTLHGAGDRFLFEPAGKRMLKGFDEPVAFFAVTRR